MAPGPPDAFTCHTQGCLDTRCPSGCRPLLGGPRCGQRLQGQTAASRSEQRLGQLCEQRLRQDDGIEGLALLRQVLQRAPGAPQDDAFGRTLSRRGAHHLSGVRGEARDLGLAIDAHQRHGDLGVVAEHAWRGATLLHLAAQEGRPWVSLDVLEDCVVTAHGGPRHDDLADVHVEVVVVQAQGLEERRELGSEGDARLDGDALGRAREGAALEGALDAQHL
mmetsp:Transcript_24922/g.76874  ORF Transcript_24922/g.76874 Transcript_24922/m.76874 type:complete len:221 (-) Transcript_24922:1247-1909(-)